MYRYWGLVGATTAILPVVWVLAQSGDGDRPPREPFAGDRVGADRAGAAEPVQIDGKRTMKYLEAICAIGPRISGSPGMEKQQQLIKKHFENLGAKVTLQEF